MEGGPSHPIGERRAIQPDALPGVDLCLAIQRQVVGELGDENLGDGRFRRQSAFDHPRGRRRLHDDILAGPAGIARTACHQNAELGRHDVKPLRPVLADLVKQTSAARAALVVEVVQDLDAWQMRWQGTAIGLTLGREGRAFVGGFELFEGFSCGNGLFDILESEQQLILAQRLGTTTEAMTLHRFDDLFQTLGARPLRDQHRLQRTGIVREGARHGRHGEMESYSPAIGEAP